MSEANYERQLLACQAAGFISANGDTQFGFGCNLTHLATGQYALLLGDSDGVVDGESFMQVQVKGTADRVASVIDVSNTQKDIYVSNASDALVDTDIEVILFKTVSR